MIVRDAVPGDAGAMAALLNRIIKIGGTTAHQVARAADDVRADYIDGPDCVTSVVAEVDGQIIGWQAIGWWQGDAHIGTFVDPDVQAKGTGAALFGLTLTAAKAAGLGAIHASIRADNVPGLAYYARIGFQDIGFDPEFALNDGTKVGRINRKLSL